MARVVQLCQKVLPALLHVVSGVLAVLHAHCEHMVFATGNQFSSRSRGAE